MSESNLSECFYFHTLCRSSPPYYSVLLYALDISTNSIPLVGKIFYAYKIAPPDLIATTAAMSGVFLWSVGKGFGSLVGGQLTEVLEITEVFFCTAIFGAIMSSCIMSIRVAFGRKWERKILEEKDIVMQQMNSINDGAKGSSKETQPENYEEYPTTKF